MTGYNNSGVKTNCKSSLSRVFSKQVPSATRHYRIGHFAVAITTQGDVWAWDYYDKSFVEDTASDPKHVWRAMRIDRLNALDEVQRCLKVTHPFFNAISKEISEERHFHTTY